MTMKQHRRMDHGYERKTGTNEIYEKRKKI